ncbi:MAG: hypothetical protein A2622_03635 [Bdellovibrionales bacterium RIFCSPHIGHO2_01_FULL_40_29]|nr:MAG: hypothetical protein A2622_03635 [Bdellovibrionales bacterium RIFCSPHIGHO2_01_FULL_40_29]OFZ35388.1 MAG: hypothetical protein A3D17_08395 [Bdellovibrionales bacterium RIFCSPHIGHO2_02_FULL_40_15]
MRSKYYLAITVTLLIMAFFFLRDRSDHPLDLAVTVTEEEDSAEVAATPAADDKVMAKQASGTKLLKEKSVQDSSVEQIEEIETTFSEHLQQLGVCLGFQSTVDAEKVEPSLENLTNSLRPALGEIVVKMDDWTQTDLKYGDGSMKRIRTEVEYLDNGSPVKRAQLYKLNDQGMPELQPLATEVATDPTDDFLNSLKADGQETLEEKGSRIYYQEGEELVVVERSGKVQSFSLSKGEKTFSCTETDASTSHCQCL